MKSEKTLAQAASDKKDDSAIIAEARKQFDRAAEAEQDNRADGLEAIEFARLGKQWPDGIKTQRETEGRPVLTINKMPAFIRQVVNDSRQNKPQIKVAPVDDKADKETAKVLGGIIRSIEAASSADIAYDTAIENAVQYHVGYIGVDIDYSDDDSFDLDLHIRRFLNPAAVYGDPDGQSADGSDWNVAFVVEPINKAEFERRYGKTAAYSWDDTIWTGVDEAWRTEETIQIAEWWTREPYQRKIALIEVTDPQTGEREEITVDLDKLETDPDLAMLGTLMEAGLATIVKQREVQAHKVRQRIINGVEVLEDNEWPGRYIPLIPVYGDEFNILGKRYIRSLVHDAMDAQRMFNFWRTAATELVALAPRVPYIGPKGFAKVMPEAWATANTVSHPYLEYDGAQPPSRQPLDSGVAAGALQESLNASDDMKAILGIYDASLGARSNETSGRAIMARQREGDVSTFHFIDNLSRSIRQVGRVLIDLIPHVYDSRRIARVMGEDGNVDDVPLNQEREIEQPDGSTVMAIHNLSVGKYDVTVMAGPSFTTKRQENAYNMVEFARAVPQAGALMIDKIAMAQDWDGADEIAERAKAMMPKPGGEQQLPPEVQQGLMEGQQAMQELQALKTDKSLEQAKLAIEQYKAETDRMKVTADVEATEAQLGIKIAEFERQPSPTPEE